MSKIVTLEYLNDYETEGLRKAVENSFENFNIKNKIKPNMTILIKPCLLNAVTKDSGETTHPAVIRAVVDCLSKLGAKCIVADSPYKKFNEEHLSEVYITTGMLGMANLTKCELNQSLKTSDFEIEDGVKTKGVKLLDIINDVDAIINIGKIKLDENLGYVGSTANIFGLIPGEMKTIVLNRLRTLGDFNDYVIDVYEKIKDKIMLNILDGVVALESNKTQRMLNCLAMSDNSYSLDAAVLDILEINYKNTLLKQANERELFDIDKPYKIVGEKVDKFKVDDFFMIDFDCHTEIKQPKGYFKTHQQRAFIDKDKCKGCKICSKICPTNAITMKLDKNNELYAEVDYKKCIFCKKCLTACPYSVVRNKTPFAYKIIMKEIEKNNK